MKLEIRQILIFSGFNIAILFGCISWPNIYPYFGLCIAIAGISIGIQQLYIFSRVEENLQFDRKDFYRFASLTLLSFGSALVFHCNALILKGDGNIYGTIDAKAIYLYKFFILFTVFSAIPITNLMTSYLFPQKMRNISYKTNMQNEKSRVFRFANRLSIGGLVLFDQADLPEKFKIVVTWAYYVMCSLVYLISILLILDMALRIPVVFQHKLIVNSAYFLAGTNCLFILHLIVFLGFAITFSIISYQFNALVAGKAVVEGCGFFISLLVLFAFPSLIRFAFVMKNFFLVLLGIVLLVAIFWVVWMRIKNPFVFNESFPTSYQRKGRFYWWIYVSFVLFAFALIAVLSLGMLQGLTLNFPIIFFTFLYFTVGCSWMVTVDLGTASKSYQILLQDFLSGFVISKIGHELLNALIPVQGFLQDPELNSLFNSENSTISTESRNELLLFHKAVNRGLEKALGFVSELKTKGSFALESARKISLEKALREFTNSYRHKSGVNLKHEIKMQVIRNSFVVVNREMLDGVLRIFVDNAVEASALAENKQIQIVLDKKENEAVIRIIDHGCGMTDQQRRLFGQRQISAKLGGTGIGSTIAIGWIKNMGGRFDIPESELGEGSTVTFYLPIMEKNW